MELIVGYETPPVTRREVAQRARTSVAVVSYVLNNGPRNVRPETRERVLAAIRELGYRANAAARTLRTKRTMAIGLIVPDASNAFFGALAREIEDLAFAEGYTLLLGNAMEDKDRENSYVRALLGRQVDGLIIAPSSGANAWIADLTAAATASVIIDRSAGEVGVSQIVVDNEHAAHAATVHLLEHGWKRIGCIAGPQGVHPTEDRVDGWRRALAEANIAHADMPLTYGTFRQQDGYSAGLYMIKRPDRPDAIIATSDEQAIGLLGAAAEVGIRVPEELGVFGFDGIENAAFSVPSLSTVEQPVRSLARSAVDRILRQIVGLQASSESVELPTKLILRRSCGCSPKQTNDPRTEPSGSPTK